MRSSKFSQAAGPIQHVDFLTPSLSSTSYGPTIAKSDPRDYSNTSSVLTIFHSTMSMLATKRRVPRTVPTRAHV
jgi:hypothetical protein